ncbi:MAG: heavy metal translocating P-type ATPase [Alphaproteobacteria bacterium]
MNISNRVAHGTPMAQVADTTDMVILPVEGMTCASCVARVEKALHRLPGVAKVSVNLAAERAQIAYDPTQTSAQEMAKAIGRTGFTVPHEDFTLDVTGMTCASCVGRIEKALGKVPGVASVQVNLATEQAAIRAPKALIDPQDLIGAVTRAGYGATLHGEGPAVDADEARVAARKARWELLHLAGAAVLTAPMIANMFAMLSGGHGFIPVWLQFALATPVQFYFGRRFYVAGFKALRAGSGNMDLLVALGTSAAYFFSLFLWFYPSFNPGGHLHFEAAAAIITFVLLGRWFESRAKRGTTAAIRALMKLRPDTARVIRDGDEITVPLGDVVTGDVAVVRPGERIPVDGTVEEGHSDVDESLITGESMPVAKAVGAAVTGGAINGAGLLRIRVTAVGGNTMLARIIKMVEGAQASKAPVQRLVDKVSAVFVPIVVAISLITFGTWWTIDGDFANAFVAAVSVLVVACPCALGLATPTAIMVGTGAAARAGILIKDAEALEHGHRIDTVVLDKTGTLTEGRPGVSDIAAAPGENASDVIRLAAALQLGSEHPLARAVLGYASEHGIEARDAQDFHSLTGRGVSGAVEGRTLYLGSRRLMQEQGADIEPFEDRAQALENTGHTVMWLATGTTTTRVLGIIAAADRIKPSAKAAVERLREIGVRSVMLTGDNERTAHAVAREIGIDTVIAGVLPDDKAAEVRKLQDDKRVVAMVGDGINDAPALAAADIGIAMGTGTDVAMHTAGITLMRGDPLLVADAIRASRATYRKIWQNLFWAFIFNVVAIPAAAAGFLTPALAGGAMSMSSVSVVSNALLLRRWRAWASQKERA